MKIIVLTINQYKEKDAIITAISETETLTFLARGILNPKSKNAALNNPLTIADVELMEGNFKHPILKSSKVLSSPLRIDMDTYYLGAILFLNEMMVNLFPEEDQYKMFAHLEMAIDNLKNKKNWLMTVLLVMNEAIKVGGFQLQANQCVLCGKRQNIVSFSFRAD